MKKHLFPTRFIRRRLRGILRQETSRLPRLASLNGITERLHAYWSLNRSIQLWYHPDYIAHCLSDAAETIDFQARRVDLILSAFSQRGISLWKYLDFPGLAKFSDLELVHEPSYLDSLTDPITLTRIFGIPINVDQVDEIILSQRRATEGTIQAALTALQNPQFLQVNLGGGFHHAEKKMGGGFCLFNDVAVAIQKLRSEGFQGRIAVLDLDFHEGNGNLEALRDQPNVLITGINGAHWNPNPSEANQGLYERLHEDPSGNWYLPPGTRDQQYLDLLAKELLPKVHHFKPEFLFYIAGNDVLQGDRLGTFSLSLQALLSRDRKVIEARNRWKCPTVITLSGGYSPQAWRGTANLIRYLLTQHSQTDENWTPDLRARFTEIANELESSHENHSGLVKQQPLFTLSEREALSELGGLPEPLSLFGQSSTQGIELALERFGILEKIRKKGFPQLRLQIESQSEARHCIRIHGQKENDDSFFLLVELIVHHDKLAAPSLLKSKGSLQRETLAVLSVDWLLIQNPTTSNFPGERPQLPGQTYPGLGISEDIQEFLVQACRSTHQEALLMRPSYFHNAAIASRNFYFLDPATEARLLLLRQLLLGVPLSRASQIIDQGLIQFADGTALKWTPDAHLLPVSLELKKYFQSDEYQNAVQKELGLLQERSPRRIIH